MTVDPKTPTALAVDLKGRRIGVISRLGGDKQIFAFEQDYIDDPERPNLSLSYKSQTGGLLTSVQQAHRRVPPFFSNLLPEGHLRTYLAERAGVKPEREFFLLSALGADLAGAVTVTPAGEGGDDLRADED
ncbi:MAG TPA: HipA N-terminal domain-containing protein, partial [Bryobacteraceae bacterium]|nr:HipA N-terminal domain-containing protein [Bryobacteraceae bacterium]